MVLAPQFWFKVQEMTSKAWVMALCGHRSAPVMALAFSVKAWATGIFSTRRQLTVQENVANGCGTLAWHPVGWVLLLRVSPVWLLYEEWCRPRAFALGYECEVFISSLLDFQ